MQRVLFRSEAVATQQSRLESESRQESVVGSRISTDAYDQHDRQIRRKASLAIRNTWRVTWQ